MMNTITLPKEKIYVGNLLLINAEYPIQIENETKLMPTEPNFPDVLMEREAINFLQLILQKIGCNDEIVPVSGYRSAAEQTQIYQNSLKEFGEEFTKKFVALPYHSEHQTGLAIDLGRRKETIDFICPDFPYEGICEEFRKTAPHYGFIERYPNDKEKITGIAHEPWHFRYVGYPHSEFISKNRLTLEEYTHFIKQFAGRENPLKIQNVIKNIEIFYLPAYSDETTLIIPEQSVCQVSGNNIDGYIVTLWRNSYE